MRLAVYEEQSLSALSQGYCVLVVIAVEQYLQRKLGVGVGGFDVPTSVIVADNLAVSFEHQLADLASIRVALKQIGS